MVDDIILAQCITSKISHDLSNVYSALTQSLELLDDKDKKLRMQAMDLLKHSVLELGKRLKWLRESYGTVYNPDEKINYTKLQDILEDLAAKNNIVLDLNIDEDYYHSLTNLMEKLLIAICITAGNQISYGGNMRVELLSGNDQIFSVYIEGKTIAINEKYINTIMSSDYSVINVYNIEIVYIKKLADLLNLDITCEYDNSSFKYMLFQKPKS
ncbi:MAG: hypothetical protein K9G11_04645 [Rickettsiaceae bacterium]|nr:hypothetical protein [Rickettsiaceae bacterium]